MTYFTCILQVNCETDFVARNNEFQEFVAKVTKAAHEHLTQQENKVNKINCLESIPLDIMCTLCIVATLPKHIRKLIILYWFNVSS